MEHLIRELEELRKSVSRWYYISVGLAFAGLLSIPFFLPRFVVLSFLIFISAFLVFAFGGRRAKQEYIRRFKKEMVKGLLSEVFDDLTFDPDGGISREVIRNTKMICMGNVYRSEDYVRAKYKGIGFEQSDVVIQNETTDSDGNTQTTTYFRGRWMVFEFNKEFFSDLQVRQKGFSYSTRKSGWFVNKQDRMNPVKMEDMEFNKLFDVYSNNPHEAYYILTPHIMDSIKNIQRHTKGKILFCFVKKKLHVAVNNNEDSFEAPIFSRLDTRMLDKIKQEISIITRFADQLNLDRNIYKQ